ncbi:MAG: DUF2007 domain-containing protein [Deltaproteobacteria bacterium]|nr:DUF2007 domain-containing protein [Deltaproteobacteria bacterium]
MATRINLVEIYLSYDEIEASIIENLLEDNGIPCVIRDMRITPYPITIGNFSEKRIAVEEDMVDEAMAIIRDAVRDGIISSNGRFKE